jgi:mannose-6-phosphate isomerase-like protein (cupin superfamily)
MSDGYTILSLDEVETASHRGSNLIPVRHTLGFRPAGVNAWIADTGGQLMPPHEEDSGNEELYVVVRGRARFTVGDESADAPAGTLVFVPAEVHRTAVAEEPQTIVLAVGGTVGQAFEAHGWETYARADSHRRAGRTEEGRAALVELLGDLPESWGAWYNAACWESLAGNPDAAFEYLRRAQELNAEAVREYLEQDADLDPIREDPRFAALLA